MAAVFNIIQHTPVWVFPLFAALLWLASLGLRRRTRRVGSLFVFPLVMLVLSVGNATRTSAPSVLALADWIGCAAIGAAIGWSVARKPLAIDPVARQITLAGSTVPLLVTVGIIVLRYSFGYLYGRYPELAANPDYALALIAGGAFLGGITFGRYGRLGLWYWRAANPAATAELAKCG
jgi:hypothetical protein